MMYINTSPVPHLHSYSVEPAFRVDFGQFYKFIQYNISYMYMYYNQPGMTTSHVVLHLSESIPFG